MATFHRDSIIGRHFESIIFQALYSHDVPSAKLDGLEAVLALLDAKSENVLDTYIDENEKVSLRQLVKDNLTLSERRESRVCDYLYDHSLPSQSDTNSGNTRKNPVKRFAERTSSKLRTHM